MIHKFLERVKDNGPFIYFSVLLCWALNAYSEIARFYREGTLFARVVGGHSYINDFVVFYTAGRLAWRGVSENLYDPQLQETVIRATIAPVVPELSMFMQSPPNLFALMKPFGQLSLGHAYIAWVALWLPLVGISLWFLFKSSIETRMGRAFAFAGAFAAYPFWLMTELGQTTMFLLPATIAFWLAMRRNRFFLSGLISAFLLVKLQYLPVFLVVGFILGRWKYLSGLAVSGTLVAIATYLTVGMTTISAYPQALVFGETSDKIAGVSSFMMQNFRGQFVIMTGGESPIVHLAVTGIFVFAIAAIAALWWRVFPALKEAMSEFQAFNIAAAITVLLMLVASPHTHMQDYSLAVIPMVFLYPLTQMNTGVKRIHQLLRALILASPVLSWLFFLAQIVFMLMRVQSYFAFALTVIVLSIVEIRSQTRSK